ncbi:MAG TPA: universal stress protein [Gemmatimonadaceae bacterium]|nr:universal stress protein [Gemmatimonadaceae bacterium]
MSTTLHETPLPTAKVAPGATAVSRNPARGGPILLACDGSGKSGAPIIAARLLADRLGLPLEIVTVLEPQAIYSVALGGTPIYLPGIEDTRRNLRIDAVREYVSRFSGDAAPVPIHARFGGVAFEVAEVARARGASLIVVGAAPHQRLNRVIAGERAVQVLRESTCPVLSVPPGFTSLPRNIVVAVDFAPASIRAAQAALLLLADGGTLTLLHLLSPLLGDAPLRDSLGRDPATAVQTMFERLRAELRPYMPTDVTIETQLHTADAVGGIVAAASTLDADVVAVGTHGPRLLERLFIGSVASSVMHAAPQAVLAAPPPPPAESLEFWLRISGTATSGRPRDWMEALDGFTRRNRGRPATLEVDDPQFGAQVMGRGYVLTGVTYDPHDHRAEIMLGDPNTPRRHLMHSIPNVESMAMTMDETGHEALELRHGRGQTLVLVAP